MPARKDLLFVGAQALLFAAIAFDPLGIRYAVPTGLSVVAWGLAGACVVLGVLAVFQLGTNLTPWPSPKDGSRLVTSGLYAYARHPIYASLLWFGLAVSLATGSVGRILVTGALWWLFRRKARYEEGMLRERYAGYAAYAKTVGRFGGGRVGK